MATIITDTQTQTTIDEDGNERSTVVTKTRKFERSSEPDYVKIYTNVWCELNQIPVKWRDLFLQLAVTMSYADTSDKDGGQIVWTGGPTMRAITTMFGWQRDNYQKGLKALCDCGALRPIQRGCYQVNPSYAGKGEWKYNPQRQQGGIEDIVARFSIKDKTIDTKIIWADDSTDNELNKSYRQGLGTRADDQTTLKEICVHA